MAAMMEQKQPSMAEDFDASFQAASGENKQPSMADEFNSLNIPKQEEERKPFVSMGPPASAAPLPKESPSTIKQFAAGLAAPLAPLYNAVSGIAGVESKPETQLRRLAGQEGIVTADTNNPIITSTPTLDERIGIPAPTEEDIKGRIARAVGSIPGSVAKYGAATTLLSPILGPAAPTVGFAGMDAADAAMENIGGATRGEPETADPLTAAAKGAVLGSAFEALKFIPSPILRSILGTVGMGTIPGALEGRAPSVEELATAPMGALAGLGGRPGEVKPPVADIPIDMQPGRVESPPRNGSRARAPQEPIDAEFSVENPPVEPARQLQEPQRLLRGPEEIPTGQPEQKVEVTPNPDNKPFPPVEKTPTEELSSAIDKLIEEKLTQRGVSPSDSTQRQQGVQGSERAPGQEGQAQELGRPVQEQETSAGTSEAGGVLQKERQVNVPYQPAPNQSTEISPVVSDRSENIKKEVIQSGQEEGSQNANVGQENAQVLTSELQGKSESSPTSSVNSSTPLVEPQPVAEAGTPTFKFGFQKNKYNRIKREQGQAAADEFARSVGALPEKAPLAEQPLVEHNVPEGSTPQAPEEMTFYRARELYASIEGERDVNKLRAFARQHGLDESKINWVAPPDKIAHAMGSHLSLKATLDALNAKPERPGSADSGIVDNLKFALETLGRWGRDTLIPLAKRLGVAIKGSTQALRSALSKELSRLISERTGAGGIFDPEEIARRRKEAAERKAKEKPIEERPEHAGIGMRDPLTEYLNRVPADAVVTKEDLIGAGVTEEHLKHILQSESPRTANEDLAKLENMGMSVGELKYLNRPSSGAARTQGNRIKLGQSTYAETNNLEDFKKSTKKELESTGLKWGPEGQFVLVPDELIKKLFPDATDSYPDGAMLPLREVAYYFRSRAGNSHELFNASRVLNDIVDRLNEVPTDRSTYKQYTPLGGSNYHEHVITLDSASPEVKGEMADIAHYGLNEPGALLHMRTTDREVVPISSLPPEARVVISKAVKGDERNLILGSFGTKIKEWAKKVFNIDEIQSDLHQRGQREGYEGESIDLQSKLDKYKIVEGDNTWIVLDQNGRKVREYNKARRYNIPFTLDENSNSTLAQIRSSEEALKVFWYRNPERFNTEGNMPNVPFKGDRWVELGIRRAIKMAVEEGKDYVTWSAGKDIRAAVGGPEGLVRFYDESISKVVNRIIRGYGGKIEDFVDTESGQVKHGFRIPEKLAAEAKGKGMPLRAEHLADPFKWAAEVYDGLKTLTREHLVPLARKLGIAIAQGTEKLRAAIGTELKRIVSEEMGAKRRYRPSAGITNLPPAQRARVEASVGVKNPPSIKQAFKRGYDAWRKAITTNAPHIEDFAREVEKADYPLGHELKRSIWLSTEGQAQSETMLDKMRHDVWGGLSAEDANILNEYLVFNRIIEEDANAAHKGTTHQVGLLAPGDAQAALASLHMTPELMNRAQRYYDFNRNELLPFLEQDGLISAAQRRTLETTGANYIPTDYVSDTLGDDTAPFYAEGHSMSVRSSGIRKMGAGSTDKMNMDVPSVVSGNVHSLVKRAFKNRAAKALWEVANAPTLASQFDVENKVPVGGKLPDAPRGYQYVYSMHNGAKRATLVPDVIAKEWMTGSEYVGGMPMKVASWLSLSRPTKFFTTGPGNPIAFTWLTPMDIGYTRLTAKEYALPVVGDARLVSDLIRAFPDTFFSTTFRKGLAREGGLPDTIASETKFFGNVENHFLNRINVALSRLSRLALAKRVYRDTGDMREAAFRIKNQLPLRRGGAGAKWIDAAVKPYFNVMVQAGTAYARHVRENPGYAIAAAASLFAYQLLWSLYNKTNPRDREVPENVRANNFYYHTGIMTTDDKGREKEVLITVRKDQLARTITSFGDATADLIMSDLTPEQKDVELQRIKNGILQSLDVDPSSYMSGPAKGAASYFLNKNTFTGSDIWKGTEIKPSSEVNDDTNPALVKLADLLSKASGGTEDAPGRIEISPSRLGAALRNSMGSGVAGQALDEGLAKLFGDTPPEEKAKAIQSWWADVQRDPLLKSNFALTDPDLPERPGMRMVEVTGNTHNFNLRKKVEDLNKTGVLDEKGYDKFTESLSDEDLAYVESQQKAIDKLADSPEYWKSLRKLPVDVRIANIAGKLERFKSSEPERFKKFKKEVDDNLDNLFDPDNQQVQEKLQKIDKYLNEK